LITHLTELFSNSGFFANTWFGYLLFYLCLSLATAIALPRQVAALSAGALFGITQGFIVATLATTTGCILTFLACRFFLANRVKQRFPQKTAIVHQFLSKNTFVKALIIRILPLGSNFLTNVIAGATKVPFKAYVLGSFIGFIPQMILFSMAGGGIKLATEQEQDVVLTLSLVAILLVIALMVNNHLKKRLSKAKP